MVHTRLDAIPFLLFVVDDLAPELLVGRAPRMLLHSSKHFVNKTTGDVLVWFIVDVESYARRIVVAKFGTSAETNEAFKPKVWPHVFKVVPKTFM